MSRSRFKKIKLYAGAMSKNCVDAILEIDDVESKVGFISSRRQIDFLGGYVNNWTTGDFSRYVRSINKEVTLCRDHGGPNQGSSTDDGTESFFEDSKSLDLIHIDPWKKYKDLKKGTAATIRAIKEISSVNSNIFFEVGTEESIRKFSNSELNFLLESLRNELEAEEFDKIVYCVIQSGVGLDLVNMKNTGTFSENRLREMITTCKSYGVLTKEHNSDYLSRDDLLNRFNLGLDAANIAPELGQIETTACLDLSDKQLFEKIYKECLNSGKWKKWVDSNNFQPENNKMELIRICGHYMFSGELFQKNMVNQVEIVKEAKSRIKDRVVGLLDE